MSRNKRQHPQTGNQRHGHHHRHYNHRLLSSTLPLLLLLLLLPTPTLSQAVTWEQSNDPTNLCSPSRTGYRATLDCRGYVYCNAGYLMGGGVIECWPNQLYNEDLGTCVYWQQVDTSKCPEFDGSYLMPEDRDENANEMRFFCGVSASNAKRVCEPCPGGSRLECTDITHNCFAGITGCRSSSENKPKPIATAIANNNNNNNINNSNINNNDSNPLEMVNDNNNVNVPDPTPLPTPWPTKWPTPLPTRWPTNVPTPRPQQYVVMTAPPIPRSSNNNDVVNNDGENWSATSVTTQNNNDNANTNNNNNNNINNAVGNVLSSFNNNNNDAASSNNNDDISNNIAPFNNNIASSYNNNNNSNNWGDLTDDTYLHGTLRSTYYCGWSWDTTIRNECAMSQPCPSGLNDQCPTGQTCFPDTPCGSLPSPTKKPTPRPISQMESSYYCGYHWDWVVNNCARATPCPYGDASGVCETGMKCIADTPCGDVNNGMPTKKPTPIPTRKSYPPVKGDDPMKRYCGYGWDWVVNNCASATPCPSGDSDRCPSGMKCIAETPCRDINNGMPTPKPTPIPTRVSYPPFKGDDPAKRFCGIDWADVTANCLTAVPCPSGYAQGVCPNGMNCIAETQCADETYLQWLRDKQANNGSGKDFVQSKPSPPTGSVVPAVTAPSPPTAIGTTLNNNNIGNGFKDNRCSSNRDCQIGLFCHQPDPSVGGYCGECIPSDGTGCSTEQVCRTAGCHGDVNEPGMTKCYERWDTWELNIDCEVRLNDIGAKCNVDAMVCESSSQNEETMTSTTTQQEDAATAVLPANTGSGLEVAASSGGTSLYQNPVGNTFFCGGMFSEITVNCLQSKPCPGGFASDFCAENEGCFSVPSCVAQYESAAIAPDPSKEPTPAPTPNPTRNPSNQPINPPAMNPAPNPSAKPIRMSTPEMSASLSAKPTPLPVPSSQLPQPTPSALSAQLPQTAPPVPSSQLPEMTPYDQSAQLPQTMPSIPSPTTAPTTTLPSKSPIINTNFCGVSWADHTKDCANSLPCPNGDECASGERCFNGSPCAMLNIDISPGDASSESNVGNFCGTEWNELMLMCKSATECTPDGDECAEGEFCYQDFVCDPPPVTTTTMAATSPPAAATALAATNDGTEINPTLSLGSDAGSISNVGKETNQGQPATGQTSPQSEPEPSNPCNLCGNSDFDWSERVDFQGNEISCGEFGWIFLSQNVVEGSEQCLGFRAQYFDKCCYGQPPGVQSEPEPSDSCNLCGNSEQDWSERVTFQGNEISCGEFGWIFLSQNIVEGSEQCLNFRAEYFGRCCYAKPTGDTGCNLCNGRVDEPWHDTRQTVTVEFGGYETSCPDLVNKMSTRLDPSSAQCTDAKNEHFESCCFERCSICGNSNLDWEATVFFSGEEVLCHELDREIVVEEEIAAGSSRCEMSQSFYAESCCIEPPVEPCNICSMSGIHYTMNSSTKVSFDGEVKTCLEMYHSLFSRHEQHSEQCIGAQEELFGQCCEEIPSQIISMSPPTMSPTAKNPDFDSWYDAGNLSSSAPTYMVPITTVCLSAAVGLMITW